MDVMLEDCMCVSLQNEPVLSYIEFTLDQIITQIQVRPFGTPHIVLHRIVSLDHSFDPVSRSLLWHVKSCKVTYRWPGNTKLEAWRFACLSRILVEIYGVIKAGLTVTKRDIFYRDPTLFKKQEVVDRYIDDIAFTCKVTRKDLNVTASPKGLVVGLVERGDNAKAVAIHEGMSTEQIYNHIRWILVVEKEAVFNSLIERKCHTNLKLGAGVIITAKGYPDLATRRFLRALIDSLQSSIPIFGLFDADPDGFEIFRCYSLGSKTLVQEFGCIVPEMKWIGLSLNDVLSFAPEGCIGLTTRDRTKAQAVLKRIVSRDVRMDRIFEHELRKMLMLNVKAEIEVLDRQDHLVNWLEKAMILSMARD